MKPSLPPWSEERVCNMEQRLYLKRCSNSSLAETVANTEELLTEILVRVPARPLVRFKCVSKHWLSLISDPNFCNLHTLQNPHPSISAVFPNTSKAFNYFVPLGLDHDPSRNSNHGSQNLSESASGSGSSICNPLNFVPHLHDTWIIQSCNGLFFCCPLPRIINTPYYVLNPTTNHFKTLIPPATGQACLLGYALAFDPSKSPHYKVLFLWSINEPEGNYCSEYHVQIYSSETRSWRLVSSSFARLPSVSYKQGVYCNGAVHWVGIDNEISYYHIDEERVRHVFSLLPTTEQCKLRKFRYFQESHCGGHLHLIDIYFSYFTQFEVLEMGRDYSGWFVKYHVDLDHTLTDFSWLVPYQFSVLFLAPEEIEGEESSSLLLHTPGEVISYNFRSKSFKSFELTPKAGVDDSFLRVEHQNYRYMETLACV